jgi:FixJ family two-component response regulator
MPGQTGLTFADRLAAAGLKVPMILISGDIDAAVVERAARLGVVELLCKPLHESMILPAIARAVTKSHETKATRETV